VNKKILIVDDEKEIVDLLEVYLSNDGYSVYKCYKEINS
jgi:two-component system, OmpR family, response regulator VanR